MPCDMEHIVVLVLAIQTWMLTVQTWLLLMLMLMLVLMLLLMMITMEMGVWILVKAEAGGDEQVVAKDPESHNKLANQSGQPFSRTV